jgi:hypothetical protein
MRLVRVRFVAVERHYYKFWVRACSTHSAWALFYLLLRPVRPYHNFPRYLINDTFCGQMLLNIKCMLEFSLHIWSETFYILRRIQRDIVTNVRKSSCKVSVILFRFKWNSNFSTNVRKILKYVSWKAVQ